VHLLPVMRPVAADLRDQVEPFLSGDPRGAAGAPV